MTVVVLDASAAAELVTRTALGRRLRKLAPSDASWWAPDHLYVEAGGAVRKMRLRGLINTERADAAIARLLDLPVTVVRSKPLLREAWTMRANLTVADALYVVLARHLDGPLLTGDRRRASAEAGDHGAPPVRGPPTADPGTTPRGEISVTTLVR